MSAIKEKLIHYINQLPDYKLISLGPLLEMLIDDTVYIEKVEFDDLDNDEKAAVIQGRKDFMDGNTIKHEDIDWDNLDEMDLD